MTEAITRKQVTESEVKSWGKKKEYFFEARKSDKGQLDILG